MAVACPGVKKLNKTIQRMERGSSSHGPTGLGQFSSPKDDNQGFPVKIPVERYFYVPHSGR